MKSKLLLSGDREDFTTLEFDTLTNDLRILANYPAPYNCSWTERSGSHGTIDYLLGLSEGEDAGLLFSFQIDHGSKQCKLMSEAPTLGAPAHFIGLGDDSALALATYIGGSISLYRSSRTEAGHIILHHESRTDFQPPFPYADIGHRPTKARQRQCHVHQVLEDSRGLIYAPDLGSDRVWILEREGLNLRLHAWLQCPMGMGPRHAVISYDELIIYVIGELSHTIIAFEMPEQPTEGIQPIDDFSANIIPSSVHPDHASLMDSSELCLHPTIKDVLYASNRWEKHIAEREPHLKNVPTELPPGDSIAIILLSSDGKRVESIKQVRTNLDTIRGMRLSDNGEFAVVVGQESGGVEIYRISGERGQVWTRLAGINEGLASGLKHAIWL